METSSSSSSNRNALKRNKQKKLSTHIDMTPMVDLAFLLVTFFILTTSMAKPKAMQIVMPSEGNESDSRSSETLSLLIGHNAVSYYYGMDVFTHQEIRWSELREFLVKSNQRIRNLQREKNWKENGVMILIKSMDDSKYGDLVNMLDEIKIARINSYAIMDPRPEEIAAIKK
ncbi:MAG: biopolymer transporter ExbD [Chitinophagaceae bacterium]|nr:biopolymer transporter ExbD [Chitinophagaceae bacterium]